MDPMKDIQTYI